MTVKLLTKYQSEFLSLKGGNSGSSKFALVKMPYCWKSRVTAQMFISADSTFQGSFTVGSGSSAVTANGWSVQQGTHRLSLSVTNDGHCVPISMVRYGSEADGSK